VNFIEVFNSATSRSLDGIAGSFLLQNMTCTVLIGIQWRRIEHRALDRVIRSSGLKGNMVSIDFPCDDLLSADSAPRYFELLCVISALIQAEYAYVRGYGNQYKRRVLRHWGIAGGLPGLFWANYFGPAISSVIGHELMARVPLLQTVPCNGGGLAVRLAETESVLTGDEIERHILAIGDQYFAPVEKSQEKSGAFSVFSLRFISWILKMNAERRDFERDKKIFPINVITISSCNGNDLHMKVWSDK